MQLLHGENNSKNKQPTAILGMLQTNKSLIYKYQQKPIVAPDDPSAIFSDYESMAYHNKDIIEKNPMINKRNLLNDNKNNNIRAPAAVAVDSLDSNVDIIENLKKFDEFNDIDPLLAADLNSANIKRINNPEDFNEVLRNSNKSDQIVVVEISKSVLTKKKDLQQQQQKEGRIAIYGDSNCLDSTHLDKPCFWLLDALLEYTMTSHVPSLLSDLNRLRKTTTFTEPFANGLPLRMPNNNLHQYSKVLDNHNANRKRDIPKCPKLLWETPIYLNITSFHAAGGDDMNNHVNQYRLSGEEQAADIGGGVNLRRKLERQKGEVRRYLSIDFS